VIVSFYYRGERINYFVRLVTDAARPYPGQTVLLRGVTYELEEDALHHRVFDLYGLNDVRVMEPDTIFILPGQIVVNVGPPGFFDRAR
jgi:hypothetical protein